MQIFNPRSSFHINPRLFHLNPRLFHDNAFIMQFIPMILILLMASFPFAFSQVSHSSVGKLFAVMLVLYYTRMNYKYGLASAIIFLIYYQMTEYAEGFEEKKEKKPDTVEDDGTNLPEQEPSVYTEQKPLVEEVHSTTEEAFETKEPAIISIDMFNDVKDEFIKEKCKNGVLMYKMMPVKNDMADHVYSEIKFNSDEKCNPCDRTCDYNIIEAKLKTQESLISKISRDLF